MDNEIRNCKSFLLILINGVNMTQEDLFEWAKQMNEKYGLNEKQLIFPFIQNKKDAKENENTK